MTGRYTTAIAVGAIAALVGVVLVISSMGGFGEPRDADGFYMSDPLTVDRPSYAVVSHDTDLLRGRWETMEENLLLLGFMDDPNDVRMNGVASASNALFMGIGPRSAVDAYLSGVAHDEITDWSSNLAAITEVEYAAHAGSVEPGPPGAEGFWASSAEGAGPQTLDWAIEPGDWTIVIMNADASLGMTAEVAFGALPSVDIEARTRTALMIGAIALLGGGLLLYLGVSGRDR